MAITDTVVQIQFTGANTYALATAGSIDSDAITKGAGETEVVLMAKGANAGTAIAGDEVEIYLLETSGDPDADPDVTDEYSTAGHADLLGTLDTFADDPAVLAIRFPVTGLKSYKLRFVSLSSQSTTISAGGQASVVA